MTHKISEITYVASRASLVAQTVKNLLAMRKTCLASIHGSRRSPEEGSGNLLQYSGLENPMDRGAWGTPVYGGHKELDTTHRLTHTDMSCGFHASIGQSWYRCQLANCVFLLIN